MIEKYNGKPYNFRSYNCWHHAAQVRADNGIKTKPFAVRTMAEAFKVIKAEMSELGHGLRRVESPIDFDIVMVSKKHGGSDVYHCGVYYSGHVSHCCRAFGAVRIEALGEFTSSYEVVSIWR